METTVESLKNLPFDVDVRVCGIPGSGLVPIDLDLSGVADPRHLVYAGIEALADSMDAYDHFLCVEDDVRVEADALERMIRFQGRSRVNEVLLPNRLEETRAGTYCVDLLAVPGWHGLGRRFEGQQLGVAVNPHSAMTFLSRRQLEYAARRVDLGRRENFFAGYMESAFANVHQPFLLWRTRDESAHQVVHMDRWRSDTLRVAAPVGAGAHGAVSAVVDDLVLDGTLCTIRGWAMSFDGSPVPVTTVFLGSAEVGEIECGSEARPDLVAINEHAAPECGFTATFALTDIPPELIDAESFTVRGPGFEVSGRWPAPLACRALDQAPEVPDQPPMSSALVSRLTELLSSSKCYLEYGTGGTTVLAARLGVPFVYGVESDAPWLAAVRSKLRGIPTDGRLELVHEAAVERGQRPGPPHVRPGDYALAVWDRITADGRSPDIVLVAGRSPLACFLAALVNSAPGTRIVFSDYHDAPHGRVVEQLVQPERSCERSAEFVVPQELARETAWALLVRHLGDGR